MQSDKNINENRQTAVLNLKRVNRNDAGTYYCQVLDQKSEKEIATAPFELFVNCKISNEIFF